jgi:ATP-dependent Lon protease
LETGSASKAAESWAAQTFWRVATANTLNPPPSPIRDRFRVMTKPGAHNRDALLPAMTPELAGERGLDQS